MIFLPKSYIFLAGAGGEGRCFCGSVTVNTILFSALEAQMEPPCSSKISRAMASPSPAPPLALETLRAITAAVSIPVVAIGGVTRANLPRLAYSGIAGAALVSAIFAAADIKAECQALCEVLRGIVR